VSERRRSLLAVTSELPWPLDTGGHLRSFHLLTGLARTFDVHLVAGLKSDVGEGVQMLQRNGLQVTPVLLRPESSARRFANVAAAFVRRGPYVLYSRHDRPEIRAALSDAMKETRPDGLYLDHLDSAVFADLAGSAVVIADMHNVYSLLAERAGAETKARAVSVYMRTQVPLLRSKERAIARRADVLFAVSSDECEYFRRAGGRNVELVPNGVDCQAYQELPLGRPGAEPVILYLGTMSWEPNGTAARFLADHILPVVRQSVPGTKLRIVGKDPPQDLRARHGIDGLDVVGRVPDVLPYLRDSAVLAVPLESGGGTRLKVLEAFAAGLPVISTAVGAEGIAASAGQHLVIAPRERFAAALVELLSGAGRGEKGRRLAKEARSLARAQYDWPVVGDKATSAIARALETRVPR
jgi:polysaccharide biosynthesis protein PslH